MGSYSLVETSTDVNEQNLAAPTLTHAANPAPLGLAAFGITTLLLSSINSGLLKGDVASLIAVVVPLAFAYGGVAQIIAGILEFKNGNTFGTVAFTSYGSFWCWFALMIWAAGAGWTKAPAGAAIGLTLALWGVFTLYMWVATFRTNFCLWVVFLLLWITFFLLAGGDLGLGEKFKHAGGFLGLATGVSALYLSFAELVNATFKRAVLPLGGPVLKA
jgi:uncharacterized protein